MDIMIRRVVCKVFNLRAGDVLLPVHSFSERVSPITGEKTFHIKFDDTLATDDTVLERIADAIAQTPRAIITMSDNAETVLMPIPDTYVAKDVSKASSINSGVASIVVNCVLSTYRST